MRWLLRSMLVGVATVLLIAGSAWVAATEKRLSAAEEKTTKLEERHLATLEKLADIKADVRSILDVMKKSPW